MSIDYQKGKIFRINSLLTNDTYIGSTTNTLVNRLNGLKKSNSDCISKRILDIGNCEIVLIENFSCASKKDLRIRQNYWCDRIENINIKAQPCLPIKQDRIEFRKNKVLKNLENAKIRRKELGQPNSYKYNMTYRMKNKDAYNKYMRDYAKGKRENSWQYISKLFLNILI